MKFQSSRLKGREVLTDLSASSPDVVTQLSTTHVLTRLLIRFTSLASVNRRHSEVFEGVRKGSELCE